MIDVVIRSKESRDQQLAAWAEQCPIGADGRVDFRSIRPIFSQSICRLD
jgi:hypothetical protein